MMSKEEFENLKKMYSKELIPSVNISDKNKVGTIEDITYIEKTQYGKPRIKILLDIGGIKKNLWLNPERFFGFVRDGIIPSEPEKQVGHQVRLVEDRYIFNGKRMVRITLDSVSVEEEVK